jgi:hypothetical protein
MLAIADVCHYTQYYKQVVKQLEQSKKFLQTHKETSFRLKPISPLILHLATKTICYNSTLKKCVKCVTMILFIHHY